VSEVVISPRVTVNRPRQAVDDRAAGVVLLGLAAVAAIALVEPRTVGRAAGASPRGSRQLHAAAALLGVSVLADSAAEHYRGSFHNKAMFAPLIASGLSILAAVQGALAPGRRGRSWREFAFAVAAGVGVAGLGFHVYNLAKRPGRLSWHNLFYAAPFGAPAALTLAGLLGWMAQRLGDAKLAGGAAKAWFGRALAGVASAGLAGTVGEVLLLHFRGAFQNPFMWLPVSLPPVASALMARAAILPSEGRAWLTRAWLWATAIVGVGGVGFHAFGISRAMGGWRNWSQNLVDGPPLPAPPSFSALALAALAALDLIEAAAARAELDWPWRTRPWRTRR
jgi:hypothetical protein